ncbi:MAG: tRNA epoxyqueuosine(34) reductase QueG [Chloroflexota bacterium]
MTLGGDLKARALALGFAAAGIAPAERLREHAAHLRGRLATGGLAVFPYFTPERARLASDPAALLPGARAVLSLVTPSPPAEPGMGVHGQVARYAHGRDYHLVARERLAVLVDYIRERVPGAGCRAFVDATPLLERAFAARAGLGWFGKHNCLITPRWGSWVTLAEVITDAPLEADAPLANTCGDCRACVDACPTGALSAPFTHRADLCLSYLTTELRGAVPRGLRPALDARVLGCDSCQSACPRNAYAKWYDSSARQNTGMTGFTPGAHTLGATLPLLALLALDERGFAARFAGTAAMRPKRRRLLRNAAVALGNLGDREAVPALVAALADSEPLVRGHAAWALGRLGGSKARVALERHRATEGDAEVGDEFAFALEALP